MNQQPQVLREYLKHEFTHDEIFEKGGVLARLNAEHAAIAAEKKAVTSHFKAKLDQKSAEIEEVGNHINNGYEHVYVDCQARMNDPKPGYKTIYRIDNGESVRSEPMTADEMQTELPFTTAESN